MKQYALYFVTGFLSLICIIIAFQTLQTGLLPTLTLIGSIGLFTLAAIVSLFSKKFGAAIGTACLLLVTPWLLMLPIGVLNETPSFHMAMLLTFAPILLVVYTGYYSIRALLLDKELGWCLDNTIKPLHKYFALVIHLIIIVLWAYSYFTAQPQLA